MTEPSPKPPRPISWMTLAILAVVPLFYIATKHRLNQHIEPCKTWLSHDSLTKHPAEPVDQFLYDFMQSPCNLAADRPLMFFERGLIVAGAILLISILLDIIRWTPRKFPRQLPLLKRISLYAAFIAAIPAALALYEIGRGPVTPPTPLWLEIDISILFLVISGWIIAILRGGIRRLRLCTAPHDKL